MERVKELLGFSGCNLYLYRNKKDYWIRKYSKDENYNERLKKQIEKQLKMYSNDNGIFYVPKILNIGMENGILFCDMQYVHGEVLLFYLCNASYKEIAGVLAKIFAAIKKFKIEKESNDNEIYTATYEKYLYIFEKFKIEKPIRNNILKGLNSLKEVNIPQSFCHGDLTLENIMVTRDNIIFLIDFLDNYYNSHWIDIAKLHQNIEYDEYKIRYPHLCISRSKKKFVLDEFKRFIQTYEPEYTKVHNTMMVNIFLRMLPYVRNEKQASQILKILNQYITENTKSP